MDRKTLIGFFFAIVVGMLCVDRGSKMWAADTLVAGTNEIYLGPINLTMVHNQGAAFGMGQGQGWLFAIIAVVIVLAIIGWLFFSKDLNTLEVVAFGLIAAGGIGNLIDRVNMGYVVDFIQFTFIDFPVFNVADMCVTVGVALVIVSAFMKIKADKDEIYSELEAKEAAKKADEEREAAERARIEAEDDRWWEEDD